MASPGMPFAAKGYSLRSPLPAGIMAEQPLAGVSASSSDAAAVAPGGQAVAIASPGTANPGALVATVAGLSGPPDPTLDASPAAIPVAGTGRAITARASHFEDVHDATHFAAWIDFTGTDITDLNAVIRSLSWSQVWDTLPTGHTVDNRFPGIEWAYLWDLTMHLYVREKGKTVHLWDRAGLSYCEFPASLRLNISCTTTSVPAACWVDEVINLCKARRGACLCACRDICVCRKLIVRSLDRREDLRT